MYNLDYGVIGNCKSAALVSKRGDFGVDVDAGYTVTQRYLEDTNILVTRFSNGNDAFEILDFMPRYRSDQGFYVSPPDLIRYIRHLSGRPAATFRYEPRIGYAEHDTHIAVHDVYVKSFTSDGSYESVYLYTSFDKAAIALGKAWEIVEDEFFLLSYNQKLVECTARMARLELERTEVYWLNWLERTLRVGRFGEEIKRSALVLKLLTFHQTGAILAAVTTSLPESPGEERNWDYRFCWIRDASMIVSVLTAIGHHDAARRFLNFVINVIPYNDEKIQIVYGIRGEKELTERELPWLSGFEASRPVRVGNNAFSQKQNDIYGVLMDLIWHYFSMSGHTIANGEQLWTIVRTLLRTVKGSRREKDKSIWELLGMESCADKWRAIREEIRYDIEENGWNEAIGGYAQYYGSSETDAEKEARAMYKRVVGCANHLALIDAAMVMNETNGAESMNTLSAVGYSFR